MSNTEKRAMDLAKNILAAVQAVDTPNRNARAMLTDAAMWSNIAFHLINAIEGKDIAEAPEAEAPEAEAPAEENGDDNGGAAEDDDDKPRKKRTRRT